MTYDEARKKVFIKWLLGVPIVAAASLSSVVSVLKMFYFSLDSGDPLTNAIAKQIKQLVYFAYDHTRFLEFFWTYSPTPTPKDLLASSTITSFFIYLCIFVGLWLIESARKLSARLAEIDKEIENQLIKESIKGSAPRRRDEIQAQVSIPKSSRFSQFHALYLAPIIVGLVVAVIVKISGLV
ncbi:MAG: YniB family protein [Betaproteobacteria bacterium]|nr:YniB family protein [Betaproteobacteria bacterium]MCL2887448.1 YniB family protein [Betaproteobacteria bacterium]